MKCSKCNKNNVTQAKYCKWCGKKFTKKEIELGKENSIPSKINKIRDNYKKLTLSKYTDSIIFKVLSIVFILIVGCLYIFNNGTNLKLINGEDYRFDYNKKLNEYYVYPLYSDYASLNMYFPRKANLIYVKYIPDIKDNSSYPIETRSLDSTDKSNLILNYRGNGYYLISLDDTFNKEKETIKVYILLDNFIINDNTSNIDGEIINNE